MTEALITGIVAIIVCTINNIYQSSKTQALIEYKIDELSKRVDKHNNLVERTYKLEEQTVLQDEKIKVANNRIADLEKLQEKRGD